MPESNVAKIEATPEPSAELTPMDMLRIAVEKNADLDKLAKLMDLQERYEANQARKAFVEALSAFKANPPTVIKDKSASFGQGKATYDYVSLPQVVAVIAPALSEHGLSHRWSTTQSEAGISVTCTLTHVMGHSESITLSAGADTSGSKNSIQAIGSTLSYLERYTLLGITGLAAADMDDDGSAAENLVITAEQNEELQHLLLKSQSDTQKFLKWAGVEELAQIPQGKFPAAKTMLERKIKEAS